MLKKQVIDTNLRNHPEVKREDYNRIIGEALYDGDLRFRGKSGQHRRDYINFVKTIPHSNSLVLLQIADYKDNYEIIHLWTLADTSLARLRGIKKS